jgi:hypothetical protein
MVVVVAELFMLLQQPVLVGWAVVEMHHRRAQTQLVLLGKQTPAEAAVEPLATVVLV